MRITSCHIKQFGTLEERRLPDLDHGLVVVLGPNEAGKSTFFHFLTTMLFGFTPVDVSKHPYGNRSGTLSGSVRFVTGSTACSVERTLKSTPRGLLTIGMDGLFGRKEDLRNRSLPDLAAVSRELFEAVYALTLGDMARIEGKAWNTIQDRLLGGFNIEEIRNPRDVISEVEKEASKLWRPDRRGKTRSRDLRERIRGLQGEVREARERDRMVRQIDAEIDRMTAERQKLERDMQSARAMIRATDRLLPVKLGLERIEQLEKEAGDVAALSGIPGNPGEQLARLRKQLEEGQDELRSREGSLRRLESAVEALDADAQEVVRRGAEIRSWQSQVALISQRRAEADELHARLEQRRSLMEEDVAAVLGTSEEEALDAVSRIRVPELRAWLRELRAAQDRFERAKARDEGASLSVRRHSPVPWAVLAALGAIVTAAGIVLDVPVVWGPGAAVASVGIALVLQALLAAGRGGAGRASHTSRVAELRADLDAKREAVTQSLGSIPIPRSRWESADSDVAEEISRLQIHAREVAEFESSIEQLRSRLKRDRQQVESLAASLSVDRTGETERLVDRLVRKLDDAEALRSASAHAAVQIAPERKRAAELRDRVRATNESLHELESQLAGIGGGDVNKGSELIDSRRSLARKAAAIRDELEARFPDLDELTAEIDAMNGSVRLSDEARAELDRSVEEMSSQVQVLVEEVASREAWVRALREEPSVADLESDIELLEEENRQVCRERDRLMLLAGILREADTSFRERHQPDVVRRASAMLRTLTSGRYDRLEPVESNDGRLLVHDTYSNQNLPVRPPLSRGTLDQIYLTLRLAISEHLDSAGDSLPLFLDEVLVNWDSNRRHNAYGLLRDLSESRQIFYFTCHEWLAAELEQHADAKVVDV